MTDPKLIPPPELVRAWVFAAESNACISTFPSNFEQRICTAAAQWGWNQREPEIQAAADAELEACCEWLSSEALCESNTHRKLRTVRRPKPPSLKEQALSHLENAYDADMIDDTTFENIRRVLEALPE
jgi:hypothetical protein